jgi:AraC family transcriptional regulator
MATALRAIEEIQPVDRSSISVTPGTSAAGARSAPQVVVDGVISLLDAAVKQPPARAREAHCMILEALSRLRRVSVPNLTEQVSFQKGGFVAWQVRRILEYINDHIADRILVADLCTVLELSEAHFSRSFRLTFGEPPHAFMSRRRLELAAHHMVHSDASLSEIALLCGFSDQAHLCRRFRQVSGQTPAAWRRARRGYHASA